MSETSSPQAIPYNFDRTRSSDEQSVMYDLVFVININSKGWILEKICDVIAAGSGLYCRTVYTERNDAITCWLPPARAYFFSHYKLHMSALASELLVQTARSYVWFTHPSFDSSNRVDAYVAAANAATMTFTANRFHKRALEFLGVRPARLTTILGGADPDLFTMKERQGSTVGLVSAYYERKRPDLLIETVRAMPDVAFMLLAPRPEDVENKGLIWENWPEFPALLALPNFRYVQAPYGEYGLHFRQMDVYLSLSSLEGGPIPLIEAMFANCVPVVTRTGFAEDVVEDGVNGYLLPVEPTLAEIQQQVRRALSDRETDIRASAADLSWDRFAARFRDILNPAVEPDRDLLFVDPAERQFFLREGWGPQERTGGRGPQRLELHVD
ncbi:MAG: glycosyltransferase family 4 protein, partial [Methylobacterium mesophilicum]|nr:glycosyltransferase family 4 protein [Methylobacterium mesophilicum]